MFDYNTLAYAYGQPEAHGQLKNSPDDFIVEEQLGFSLTGEGEHLFLYIEKRGLNTEELVKALARSLQRPAKTISYAGLKDRQATTRQWLSIHCPGEHIENADSLNGEGWRVLQSSRHNKKLKTGALSANQFQLVLREVDQINVVEQRLAQVKKSGVPNYFGEQRFGYQGQNLIKAQQVLFDNAKIKDRFLRGIYYSAARSMLFNLILSRRIELQNWNKALAGDVMQLSGTHSIFQIEQPDEAIVQRVAELDLSPAAPLWGKGAEMATAEALDLQQDILREYQNWCEALERHDLQRAYRALRLPVTDLIWQWQDNNLSLQFSLDAGCYATSVVRELMKV